MPVTQLCTGCSLPAPAGRPGHQNPEDCVAAQALAMKQMLNNVGQQGLCRGCSKPGYWVTHYNGKATFYTPAGLNHFVDCPAESRFRRK